MATEWTGRIVGLLHTHRITQTELATELGVTAQYVSMVLNGKKSSKGIDARMADAIQSIVDRRNAESTPAGA
jgi:transcriptional regulator with XRE-family HTH domain